MVLRVSPMNFYSDAPGCSEDIMQTFFSGWTGTTPALSICSSLCVIPAKTNSSDNAAVLVQR